MMSSLAWAWDLVFLIESFHYKLQDLKDVGILEADGLSCIKGNVGSSVFGSIRN